MRSFTQSSLYPISEGAILPARAARQASIMNKLLRAVLKKMKFYKGTWDRYQFQMPTFIRWEFRSEKTARGMGKLK